MVQYVQKAILQEVLSGSHVVKACCDYCCYSSMDEEDLVDDKLVNQNKSFS